MSEKPEAVGISPVGAGAGPAGNGGRQPRVMHFVTGGFSGATQVAIELVRAHQRSGAFDARLVLRDKRQTPPERVEALRQAGLPVTLVSGKAHLCTIWQLRGLCRQWRPDILVAHGFSEHLWGRYAGLLAGVPHMVHVEHNSRERYTWFRLRQARWLAGYTDRIIGCSEGVATSLRQLGFPAEKITAIANGISLQPYEAAAGLALSGRRPDIVMSARFARQKDHGTLLRAVQKLKERGLTPTVWLAGGGSERMKEKARQLGVQLGISDQLRFLGVHPDVPGLLMARRICVLSSHYEGMPLSLIEGMAAGCAVVGSRVPGVQEVIENGRNGLLVGHEDAVAMADALETLLRDEVAAQAMADAGLSDAREHYSLARMAADYEREFSRILGSSAAGRC